MARLLGAVIIVVIGALILGVSGSDGKAVGKRDLQVQVMTWDQFVQWFCPNNDDPFWVSICGATTTPISSTTSTTTSVSISTTPVVPSVSTTNIVEAGNNPSVSASAPQNVPWCELPNGTYIPNNYKLMYTNCDLYQCTLSHAVLATTLQCMPTYCIDGSTPVPRNGQCCSQCAYEKAPTACVVNGFAVPHGVLLSRSSNDVQCWCQLGSIECRQTTASLFSSLDLWGSGTAVYVIVIIICVLLIFGTLLCCGGTVFFYYYYQRQQQTAQQAYADYYNNAGWQPVGEDGQVVEGSAEDKQAEAEQSEYQTEYPTGNSEEYIPPPYAHYNGSYVNEQDEKQI